MLPSLSLLSEQVLHTSCKRRLSDGGVVDPHEKQLKQEAPFWNVLTSVKFTDRTHAYYSRVGARAAVWCSNQPVISEQAFIERLKRGDFDGLEDVVNTSVAKLNLRVKLHAVSGMPILNLIGGKTEVFDDTDGIRSWHQDDVPRGYVSSESGKWKSLRNRDDDEFWEPPIDFNDPPSFSMVLYLDSATNDELVSTRTQYCTRAGCFDGTFTTCSTHMTHAGSAAIHPSLAAHRAPSGIQNSVRIGIALENTLVRYS